MIKLFSLLLLSIPLYATELFDLTPSETLSEKKQGHEFLQMLWDSNSILSEVESQVYLNRIGQEMVSYGQNTQRHFDFFLIDDDSLNAFAGPYGYIGIHSGLILSSESEAELAGVLAHEIAHVTQNHLVRFSEKNDKQAYLTWAGMLAAALVNHPEASQAIATSTVAGAAQQSINFTREHEWEADRVGTDMLKRSGYNPKGLADFFAKLESDPNAKEFLRTHPLGVNRMADTIARVARDKGDYRADSFDYLALKMRLYYQTHHRLKHTDNPALKLYAQAYQAFNQQQYQQAKAKVAALLTHNQSAASLILASRIAAKLKQTDQAIAYLQAVGSPELKVYYLAQAYQEAGQYQQGIQPLRGFLRQQRGTYQSNKLLSELYVAAGHLDRAHIYQAQALVIQGRLQQAIDQYQRAKILTNSQDRFDVLEVKIEQLQKQIDLYKELD